MTSNVICVIGYPDWKNMRVLVIDDEPDILLLFRVNLEIMGDHEVTDARNGQEALRILERERFDVIVTDYMMPKMSGIEVIREIKAMGITTPVIVVTAYTQKDKLDKVLEEGAVAILGKPIDFDEVMEMVSEWGNACRD